MSSRSTKRTSRRTFVKGTVTTIGVIGATQYVTPELQSIGIPTALAASPGGEEPPDEPPASDCSLSLTLQNVRLEGDKVRGDVCVTNDSGSGGSCQITAVKVYVEGKPWGRCSEPTAPYTTQNGTGGSNSLNAGDTIPGPKGATTCFTLEATPQTTSGNNKVHVIISFKEHHQFPYGRSVQVCDTTEGV